MEYIPGADLRKRLEDGPLSAAQVCWLGFDLAEGLAYVHDAGFIHHDIKPANVLLADRDAETRIRGKLTDFGISTIIGGREDGEFTTGTAAYLSPEQVEGGDATPAIRRLRARARAARGDRPAGRLPGRHRAVRVRAARPAARRSRETVPARARSAAARR